MISPILIVPCACAGAAAASAAARLLAAMKSLLMDSSLFHPGFDRILDVLDLVELHVDELAADLLDPAQVDRLHDVARLGIDQDRAARALPFHALGSGDQGVTVGLAAGLLQHLEDQVDLIPAGDRE